MNPRMKTLSFALVQVFGVGVAMSVVSAPASAQQTAQTRERIEVTGSNIKRVEGETALPVTVISKEEIQNSGVQTAQDLLDRMSSNQSFGGFTEQRGAGSTLVGFTGASLRGFGSQRTLILLNGKRIAPYALSNTANAGVDLSAIPVTAIERIEILRDGASAVYGTDAIAGVINFILRKDFRGVEASATYLRTEHGGGNSKRYNASAGIGDLGRDRYNIYFTADYLKQDSLKANAREISHSAYIPALGVDRTSGNAVPANISQPGGFVGTRNPTIPLSGATASSCLPPFSFPTIQTANRTCRFDFASTIDTIPEFEKENYIAKATVQLGADHQAFVEGSYYKGKFEYRVSPTPVSTAFTLTNMSLPPTSPFFPAAFIATLPGGRTDREVLVSYRTVELGPRSDEAKVSQSRVVAGLQGTFRGWDYSTAFNWNENKQTDTYVGGYISEGRFGPLLRSGVINPFVIQNTQSVHDQMAATQILGEASSNKAKNVGWDGKISNEIMQLPAGPLAFAVGLDFRKEYLQLTNAPFLSSGDIIGGAGSIPSLPEVSRKVSAGFVEFNVPLLRNVEANIAARYDRYSDFGNTTNPKFTLRYTPTRELLLRAAYGTGFRAPTLYDLFQPELQTNTLGSYDDPRRCPTTQSTLFDCNLQFNARQGGNDKLQPEKSRQWYFGAVWEPNAQFSAGLDYYRIRIRNLITTIDDSTIFADFDRWEAAGLIRRAAPDATCSGCPGRILFVVENIQNVGLQETSGIDVDLTYRMPPTPFGRFTAKLNGSYVLHWKQTTFDSTEFPDFVGTRANSGAIVRWRHYASLDWTTGPFGATLVQSFQSGYTEDAPLGPRRVGTYEIYDLQGRFTAWRNIRLELGVRNLFDRAPPVSVQNANFQVGYDPAYGDPRGRMYYGTVRVSFK